MRAIARLRVSGYFLSMNIRRLIGDNIRAFRELNGLSQEELGDIAGMNRVYIGAVERGERNITIDNLSELAEALQVPLPILLTEGASRWVRPRNVKVAIRRRSS